MNITTITEEHLEDTTMPTTIETILDDRRRGRRSLCAALLFCLGLCLLLPVAGWAQIDPGTHTLHQNDVLVGVILVPARDAEVCRYTEYWFLFDTYRYPSAGDPVSTTIRSEERLAPEVLERLSSGRGHWVEVEATEDRADCR